MSLTALAVVVLSFIATSRGDVNAVVPRSQGSDDVVYDTATLTGFAGRSFEFKGLAGRHYTLLAEKNHKLVARFQQCEEDHHVTSFIDAMGLTYRNHTVLVELDGVNALSVTLDKKPLRGPATDELTVEYALDSEDPANTLSVVWQVAGSVAGSAVIIRTELLALVLFLTPGEDGADQALAEPAFLNFDIALLGEPTFGDLQGVIGETYARLQAGQDAFQPGHPLYEKEDGMFHKEVSDYATPGFFEPLAERGPKLAGSNANSAASRRRLAQVAAFPLNAGGRALLEARAVAPRPGSVYRRLLH